MFKYLCATPKTMTPSKVMYGQILFTLSYPLDFGYDPQNIENRKQVS